MALRPAEATRTQKRSIMPWLGIELRHLAALQAVVDAASFNGAAEQLGYTQSAISQQIAALERIVGQRLVDRGSRGRRVKPTEAGLILLQHARSILAAGAAAQADLASLADGSRGRLVVGVYESAGARVLPALVREFLDDHPDAELELVESITDPALLELLAAGELDLCFAILPLPEGPFEAQPLFADPYVLVVPDDSPLRVAPAPTLGELAALPIICLKECRSAEHAISLLTATGSAPNVVFRAGEAGTVEGLVEARVGVALMPSLAFGGRRGLTAIALGDLLPPRVTALVRHRDRDLGRGADAFAATAARICGRIATPARPADRAA